MALYLRYAVRSDLGLVRSNNEDSVYAGPRLLAIADGMGGHAAGEVASKIVISTLEPLDEDRRIEDLMKALRDAVADANERIAEAVESRSELEGMGTTLTALRFVGGQVGLAHVGDSRAYLLRNEQLNQITHDATYVQYLVDAGKLTPDEAKDHPRKSVILRALLGTEVEADVSIREARAGDRYLLCSDGLSDVVSTETIADTLRIADPQDAADRLVELALRGGGPDNVTVIVADVVNARVGDRIDDVPVIAGAFVDPSAADVPGSDSAAGRAALMARPHRDVQAVQHEHRTWSWKPWLLAAAIVVLLAAALGGTYLWTQTQYFVGRADADVAIYRGVNTQFGPLKFFNVYKVSNLKLRDLNPSVRSQVRDGINASDQRGAESIIGHLRSLQLPLCSTIHPIITSPATGSASTSASGKPSAKSSAKPSGKSTKKSGTPGKPGSRKTSSGTKSSHTKSSTTARSKKTAAKAGGATTARASSTPAASPTSTPPSTASKGPVARPGQNCRP